MIAGIIPARYGSSRFPGKPLADIAGKSMIQRVYEQAAKSKSLQHIVVATDDERIAGHVQAFGGNVVITAAHHASGTDRCMEALQKLPGQFNYVINIQGDEPFIQPGQIDELAAALQDGQTELATQMIAVESEAVLFDEGEVKIVLNEAGEALYFSRMVIPYIKGVEKKDWHRHHRYYRHVGMYAYRTDILEKISRLPVSALEQAESLEQLRWLQNGFTIKCVLTQYDSYCIDSPADLESVLKLMGNNV
ncbi:MAG TPA: 3-deoxy-manno-octulosonate cytidylyltransferase [Ferruginibacter sp.]|nr:3-deoxy-manno-octulosonate cytidylyltransferase [Ferruginibacter sp.]HMP21941.1 3-deoxy-manno-octulosonate cytidylyltransferase [Ferruginibacter sp.]